MSTGLTQIRAPIRSVVNPPSSSHHEDINCTKENTADSHLIDGLGVGCEARHGSARRAVSLNSGAQRSRRWPPARASHRALSAAGASPTSQVGSIPHWTLAIARRQWGRGSRVARSSVRSCGWAADDRGVQSRGALARCGGGMPRAGTGAHRRGRGPGGTGLLASRVRGPDSACLSRRPRGAPAWRTPV